MMLRLDAIAQLARQKAASPAHERKSWRPWMVLGNPSVEGKFPEGMPRTKSSGNWIRSLVQQAAGSVRNSEAIVGSGRNSSRFSL
jgi:hypothetical protein